MIVGKTKNTPQGLPYGVAVAGLSWSVLVSQFDFAQSKTVETVPGSYAVLEFDVYTTVLVELNLLGMGGREVVPVIDRHVVVIETDNHFRVAAQYIIRTVSDTRA